MTICLGYTYIGLSSILSMWLIGKERSKEKISKTKLEKSNEWEAETISLHLTKDNYRKVGSTEHAVCVGDECYIHEDDYPGREEPVKHIMKDVIINNFDFIIVIALGISVIRGFVRLLSGKTNAKDLYKKIKK